MADESIWKKEISFGRKRKPEQPEEMGAEPDADASHQPTSIWKKELSFGRKKNAVEEPEPVVADEPVAEAPVADEAPIEEQVWTRAVSFGRKDESADVPAPEADAEPPAPEPVVDEQPVEEQVWTRAVSFGRKDEAEFGRKDEAEPEPVTEPVAEAEPALEPAPAVPDGPTETWSAAPSLPPEPVAQPTAAAPLSVPEPAPGIHAPVTAEELPPVPGEEKKVPFWKRDISLGGGGKKAKTPKAEREPKQPKEKKQKQPKATKAPKVKVDRGSRGAKRMTGLKVGASQLAAARVANNGSAELLQVAREPLEPGIVVGGELRDPDALAEALKDFFAKHNLPKKGVRLGIANNRIGVRTFEVAGIDDQKQLTNAVRFRAQEALPIPIDEAVLDFHVLGEGVDDEGNPTKRILLVVAYRELIDRYLDACKKAGIQLVGIDLEAFALLRALQAPQEGAGEDSAAALVAVAIGHDRSTFAVSNGRTCEFTRVLEWGGSALNVAIARALDAAPSEVDGVKRALALTDEMVPEGLTPEQAKKGRDAMRRAIQTFARELVSSLQYYQNQPGSLGIGEIVLTGGTAHLAGLASELERLIGVRVRVGDPLARMKVSKKLGETGQVGSLAVAIGLGIED
ncbi:MAG: type IV pilus assembly protein PilM [Gaiellaceae bacterium]